MKQRFSKQIVLVSTLEIVIFVAFIFASIYVLGNNSNLEEEKLPNSSKLAMPNIFSNHMVLQQNDSVKLWGNAKQMELIKIETTWGQTASAHTDKDGNWKINILTPSASLEPQKIIINNTYDTIILSNVLIGEVWLCSGQSNMLFRLKYEDKGDSEIANANNVSLRLYKVPPNTSSEPLDDIQNASWKACSSASVKDFSAVAYYFGKNLLSNLAQTPVGLISAAYGSSTVEAFMSKTALLSKAYIADHYNNYVTKVPSKVPTACFNAMINPIIPYTIKGIAWYQGESNCVRASHYYEALETIIKYRRVEFENQNLPFYIVQLPPYNYNTSQQEPGDIHSAATLREAQLRISKNISNTGLVVTIDLADGTNLHPSNKEPVGERLANLALNQSYGQTDKDYSGPIFNSYSIEGDKIRLKFDFVDSGIKDTYEELNWFTIAGNDKKYYQGNAFIRGKEIVVSSPFVDKPVAVRFAWHNAAVPNFFNNNGIPASPFRTDEWTDFSYVKNITSWSSMPDIRNVPFELSVPAITTANPSAGKRVKQQLAAYKGTNVYHTLYLPKNWEAGKTYPVIVEYPGNGPFLSRFDDKCSGKPEDTYLGYGISGGEDFIWIGMPFINVNKKENQLYWWGDVEASVDYTIKTVRQTCKRYGGDTSKVFVSGFSRGAIACNYIGLHNDEIADLWCGFIANSHYDGVRITWKYPNCDANAAIERLKRLRGRPQIIIQEGAGPVGTMTYIENTDIDGDYTYLKIPYRNHDLRWVLQDLPEREILRNWVKKLIQ